MYQSICGFSSGLGRQNGKERNLVIRSKDSFKTEMTGHALRSRKPVHASFRYADRYPTLKKH